MKIHWKIINEIIPAHFTDIIKKDVEFAFDLEENGSIAINPSRFFRLHSDNKLKAIVANQAEYLSKGFQKRLVKRGWSIEETIDNQTIDGFISLTEKVIDSASINKENFYKIVKQQDFDSPDFIEKIISLYRNYYKRNCFIVGNDNSSAYFLLKDKECKINAGLEFETGNIASSFRAISKLNGLYDKNLIDIGIFITSIDKYVSTRIWPSSNRNGSIEELKNRRFLEQIKFPLILIGFEPDSWDNSVPFLKRDGSRFSFSKYSQVKEISGKKYYYHEQEDIYMLIE